MRLLLFISIICLAIDLHSQLADCQVPYSQAELNINNVRMQISNGLQHFEDNGDAGFQVPKAPLGNQGIHSIYADGLWVGGYSSDEQLHLAAVTYRSGFASDYYPGPLKEDGPLEANTEICELYDNVFVVDRTDAILHREYQLRLEQVANGADPSVLIDFPFEDGYETPESFYDWPAVNSSPGYSYYLAPFYDWNSDGQYNPDDGDYPGFDLTGDFDCQDYNVEEQLPLMGHQAAWYVCNDKGLHTETGGTPLGIEVQVMNYAYSHCDALNDATFTRNLLINRSSNTYTDCSIGKWLDMDVGCPTDDFVACDVARGLAYTYNGDDNDIDCDGVLGYGSELVAQGVTLLNGPFQDEDGLDNPLTDDVFQAIDEDGIVYGGQGIGYGDGLTDNERMSLRNFLYYNRSSQTGVTVYGEPDIAIEFYAYMNSTWKNGTHVTYGGFGATGEVETDYMFPVLSDPLGVGTDGQITNGEWSEESEDRVPGDRRFILSTGNFTMEPGEVNELTVGYIWARDTTSTTNAVDLLKETHDLIQMHFDNCFELIDDYPIPDNFLMSQNGSAVQVEFPPSSIEEIVWDFGDGASSIGQSAIHTFNAPGHYEVCVSHNQCGELRTRCDSIYISPSEFYPCIQITRTEGRGCGLNQIELLPEEIDSILQGPDFYEPELTYLRDHGPIQITVYDSLNFVPGEYALRLYDGTMDNPEEWKLWKVGETDTIYSDQSIDEMFDQYISEFGLVVSIGQPDHSVAFNDHGLPRLIHSSLTFEDPIVSWLFGVQDTENNTEQNWIRAGENFNTIVDPSDDGGPNGQIYYYDKPDIDNEEKFEDILGGTWAPWHLGAQSWFGPASLDDFYQVPSSTRILDLNNVTLRFTSDKTLWTRCPVIENGQFDEATQGGAMKNGIRRQLSVDKDGLNQLEGGDYEECTHGGTQVFTDSLLNELNEEEVLAYISSAFPGQDPSLFTGDDLLGLSFGMSWFPGYAVDIETGYRLNIMFSENSMLPGENGADMLWNPTSQLWNPFNGNVLDPTNARFGGGHYVYVFRNHLVDQASNSPIRMPGYDHGQFSFMNLQESSGFRRKRVFRAVTWIGLPLLAPGHQLLPISEGLIPTETTVQFRVSKKYRGQMYDTFDEDTERFPLYNFTVPENVFFQSNDEALEVELGLYPNPATNTVRIVITDEVDAIDQLKIFDITGRMAHQSQNVASPFYNLNISTYSQGVYLVHVKSVKGKESVTRFIKE